MQLDKAEPILFYFNRIVNNVLKQNSTTLKKLNTKKLQLSTAILIFVRMESPNNNIEKPCYKS